jgi:hypothetical protein
MSAVATPSLFGVPVAGGALMKPSAAADEIAFERSMIYALVEAGSLEAHRHPGAQKTHLRITRRSVIAYQARAATYESAELFDALLFMASTLSDAQRTGLATRLLKGTAR